MRDEAITEIGIDSDGRLCVRPSGSSFEQIYRTASGIHWNGERGYLFAPIPREWTQGEWFERIVAKVADEYRIRLRITSATIWADMTREVETELRSVALP